MATVTNKLREALEAINRIDTIGLKRFLRGLVDTDVFDGGLINKTISAVEEARSAVEEARRALSAPPRHCDLKECSTEDGMISAHEEFCKSWHDDGKYCAECPYNPRSPMMTCREKWLLASATERKGDGDGRGAGNGEGDGSGQGNWKEGE